MITLSTRVLCLFLSGATAIATASELPRLADPTPAGDHFNGKIVWLDLFTPDPAGAQAFYTGLLGWGALTIERTTKSGTHPYAVLTNDGEPVAGIARRPSRLPGAMRGRWVGYVSVPDVAAAVNAATGAGGRVLFPARNLPQRGVQAMIIDAEGAELGLIHSSSGDPAEFAADPGDWTWAQLFARDPAAEGRFYSTVAGFDVLPDTRNDRPDEFILASGGYSRASVVALPQRPKARPAWLFFVRVEDVKAAAEKAVSLGGRILVAPSAAPTEYWRAIVADPSGGVIGLVQLEKTAQTKEQP